MDALKKKRKTKFSPTQYTMAYLRKRGCPCAVVEKWLKIGKLGVRKDCFGGDILSLIGQDTAIIQAGVGSNHAEKIKKASGLLEVKQWLTSPYRFFQVWTWSQRVTFKKGGGKSKVLKWTPRVSQLSVVNGEIVASDFELS